MAHFKNLKLFFEDSCISHAVWHWSMIWNCGISYSAAK